MAWRSLAMRTRVADRRALLMAGNTSPISTMMMLTTTSISGSVKPPRRGRPFAGRSVVAEVGDVIFRPVNAVDARTDDDERVLLPRRVLRIGGRGDDARHGRVDQGGVQVVGVEVVGVVGHLRRKYRVRVH